jgi:hypothetical protein
MIKKLKKVDDFAEIFTKIISVTQNILQTTLLAGDA